MTPPDAPAVPDTEPMVSRNLRTPRDLWNEAAAKAQQEDPPRGITVLVRDLLECYRRGQITGKPR